MTAPLCTHLESPPLPTATGWGRPLYAPRVMSSVSFITHAGGRCMLRQHADSVGVSGTSAKLIIEFRVGNRDTRRVVGAECLGSKLSFERGGRCLLYV